MTYQEFVQYVKDRQYYGIQRDISTICRYHKSSVSMVLSGKRKCSQKMMDTILECVNRLMKDRAKSSK